MNAMNCIEKINKLINKFDMLLIYFGGSSCSVCNAIKPKLEKMVAKYANIKLIEIEAENYPELSATYNVFSIPVIILFIQGKETIKEARIISLEKLEQKISRYYELFYTK